jgi:uncharacterized protein
MKLALIGATGFVGSALLNEALARGHVVVALARDPAKVAARPGLEVRRADVLDSAAVEQAVKGCDAVASAYNAGWANPNLYDDFLHAQAAIVSALQRGGPQRLLVVGGAGSLYVAPGVQLVDTPDFPAQWKTGALAAREALNRLRDAADLDWTFVSPPIQLEPGERSGRYRLGGDEVLADASGRSAISVADLAVAIVDELEKPQHLRRRFTVAY